MNKYPTLAAYAALLAGKTCQWDGRGLPAKVDVYDHSDGWYVDGFDKKQWLSVQCPKCHYDWSLNKLGIPRPYGNLPVVLDGGIAKPVTPYVLKFNELTSQMVERAELSEELLKYVSECNGAPVEQIRVWLLQGLRVYTNFSYYVLE